MKSTTDIQMSKMSGNSFNDIYTSYYKKSFFFAKSYVHNDLAAEDIASEALIKLWEKLKAEPVEEKYILPLLLTILKNKALDYLKHEEVKRSAFEVMADWQQQELSIRMSALEACNPDEIFSEEVEKIISATLSTLSEQTRRAFILSRFENKSNKEIAEEMEIPVERVREILKISQEPVSLETPIGEEEDSHLGDFIQDDNVPVPADAAAFTLLKEQLVEVLSTLTDREQKVLRLRFGLDDGRARTLEEVGKEFNVTRERIRQIEAKALRKLRHPSRSRKLKDYLD